MYADNICITCSYKVSIGNRLKCFHEIDAFYVHENCEQQSCFEAAYVCLHAFFHMIQDNGQDSQVSEYVGVPVRMELFSATSGFRGCTDLLSSLQIDFQKADQSFRRWSEMVSSQARLGEWEINTSGYKLGH